MGHPRTTAARRLVRRAPATVVSAVLVLVGLNLALIAYVHLRPGFRDPVFDAKLEGMASRFAAAGDADRVAVLGSSRTAAGVDPKALEAAVAAGTGRPAAAFNMAQQGDGPVSQLVHFRRMRDAGKLPDLAVAELLPSGFAWFGDRPYDAGILRPDRITGEELDAVARYGLPVDEMRPDWREATWNPWFGFRFQMLSRINPIWQPPGAVVHRRDAAKDGGWAPWEAVGPDLYKARVAIMRRAYEGDIKAIDFTGPHAAALPDLVRECQAANVRVVVVVPPEGSDFRSWYPADTQAAILAFMDKLRRETGVTVVDARTWMPDCAFSDGHHLARPAAGAYSERLAREVVVPALRAASPAAGLTRRDR